MQNLAVTFGNISLQDDLQESSKELVFTLTNIVETRSNETGAHILRVALVSERLAQLKGLSDYECTMIRIASPLHDIGKIGIPDSILHKPEKLSANEWEVMKKHVDYGVAILKRSKSELMAIATQIAGTHHERWDGTGYPYQLSGEDIPIAGRITALADVFDALSSKRCYKSAWDLKTLSILLLPNAVNSLILHWWIYLLHIMMNLLRYADGIPTLIMGINTIR